jgi:hypothetical protein
MTIIELFRVDEGLLPLGVVVPPITSIIAMLHMSCSLAALLLTFLLQLHLLPSMLPTIRRRLLRIVGPTMLHGILKHTNHLVNPLIHLVNLHLRSHNIGQFLQISYGLLHFSNRLMQAFPDLIEPRRLHTFAKLSNGRKYKSFKCGQL